MSRVGGAQRRPWLLGDLLFAVAKVPREWLVSACAPTLVLAAGLAEGLQLRTLLAASLLDVDLPAVALLTATLLTATLLTATLLTATLLTATLLTADSADCDSASADPAV